MRLPTEYNFSQEVLSKKLKVHPNLLSRYDHDPTAPSIELVQRIADMLDVSIDQLL